VPQGDRNRQITTVPDKSPTLSHTLFHPPSPEFDQAFVDEGCAVFRAERLVERLAPQFAVGVSVGLTKAELDLFATVIAIASKYHLHAADSGCV
jgi:hypothetical protein